PQPPARRPLTNGPPRAAPPIPATTPPPSSGNWPPPSAPGSSHDAHAAQPPGVTPSEAEPPESLPAGGEASMAQRRPLRGWPRETGDRLQHAGPRQLNR